MEVKVMRSVLTGAALLALIACSSQQTVGPQGSSASIPMPSGGSSGGQQSSSGGSQGSKSSSSGIREVRT